MGFRGYNEVPIFGNTKDWFKKDIKTVKNSVEVTLRKAPVIVLVTFFLTAVFYYLLTGKICFEEILAYFLIFTPVAILGYFLLHVIETKGYDIGASP